MHMASVHGMDAYAILVPSMLSHAMLMLMYMSQCDLYKDAVLLVPDEQGRLQPQTVGTVVANYEQCCHKP